MTADLVGIEIDRKSVRAIVLGSDASSVVRFAETSISTAQGESTALANLSDSIQSLWRELGLDLSTHVQAAVAVSHIHAGVGSGPSIESWIDNLGTDLGVNLVRVGERFEGVSYVPEELLDSIKESFEPLGVKPDRVELAPISAARCFEPKSTCSFTVESGVSWQARVHSGLILEAMVAEDPSEHNGVAISKGPDAGKVTSIDGLDLGHELLASLRVSMSDISVAAGAARGLVDRTAGNLLEGTIGKPRTHRTKTTATKTQQQATSTQPISTAERTAIPIPHPTPKPEPSPDATPTNKPTTDTDFRPLAPQHVTSPEEAPGSLPAATTQTAPTPLEPGEQRAGFEPNEEESEPTPDSSTVTPAFLPRTGAATDAATITEPSLPATISPPKRKRVRRPQQKQKRSKRPSKIEAQRPKIERHEDEFPSEPFAGKTQKGSTYNLKLIAAALAVLIIIGLIIFFINPV